MHHFYKFSLLAIFFALIQNANAQQLHLLSPQQSKNVIRCYTVEVINEFRKLHPNTETDAQFESVMNKKIQERKALREQAASYTIPVIFHIVHNGEASGTSPNLSAALISQQLLQLNKDYANLSNSQYAVAANTGIQFVLAKNNPGGTALAEPGIDRLNRNTLGWTDYTPTNGWRSGYIDSIVKPASIWDAENYYNVWIIPGITNGTDNLLGYATFPTLSTLPGIGSGETASTAGVVVVSATVGSAFSPAGCGNSYASGKTLSHETGHFFGLRHIWGDTDCGNDFCDDTPVHFTSNRGVPSHPKSNSCGTADEMFENYMDYTDDIVLNTFTANQVDRMQTVMLHSPRRVLLASSGAGVVPVTASNKISFTNCAGTLLISETATNNGYPRYKDVFLTLNTEDKATANATVNIVATGTAISGTDYQLLTPTTLSYSAGDNAKPVNVRIFDNALVNGDKTLTLSYTITGTGVTAGSTAQSLAITIADDDSIRIGENTINLLSEDFEHPAATTLALPVGWSLLTTGSAYPNKFVASINGDAGGSGLAAHVTNNTTTKPNTYTKGTTGAAVLQSPVIDASSVLALGTLSFNYKIRGRVGNDDAYLTYTYSDQPTGPFYYFGSVNGVNGYGPYSSNTTILSNSPVLDPPVVLNNAKFSLDFYWETSALTTGVNPGLNVDDIVLTATPFHVETAVSNSYTYDIKPGTNTFKSTNNNAIATITDPSVAVSAITARVTQSGNSTVPLTTNSGAFLRTQKVFQLSPGVANTTVTYKATFYFTEAELTAWGVNKLNLKILKVKDGVDLNSTINVNNAELITPVVVEDATAGYIAYTGNFTGFSQFVLVSPTTTLPVTLINFVAVPSQKSIQLKWSTSLEINNRGFMVERSTDATHFKQIGWVNGTGTTSLVSNYDFTDAYVQPTVVYYYRIRQTDIDGREVYSEIRNARISKVAGIVITVSPNPATGFINLFIAGTSSKASVELINSAGQRIKQQDEVNAFDGVYRLPLGTIAKGTYHMVVHLPEGSFTKKIVVE